MDEGCEYIEKILLEIIDRPRFWLEKGNSNKFNIGTFDSQKAALAFLQQYNRSSFVKAQKITLSYNNQQLHLIVRHFKYGNIDENCEKIFNTSVQFIYQRIFFCQIKWPKVLINNQKQSQSQTTQQIINQKNKITNKNKIHLSSLSNIIQHSQDRTFQSNKNFQRVKDQCLILGHTNDEENPFQSSIIIDHKQNHLQPIIH